MEYSGLGVNSMLSTANSSENGSSSKNPTVEDVFLEQLLQRCRRKIKLNVGGRCFVTSLTTLTAERESMLAAMFSGRHKLELEEDMSVFIDRNGDAFAPILEWLRTGVVSQKILESEGERRMVLEEARYFQLEVLAEKLEEIDSLELRAATSGPDVLDSTIIKLNIGGRQYSTTRTTLTSESDSMLAAMFSGRHSIHQDEDGCVFIDRDGDLFAHVLNWLRSRVIPPLDNVAKAGLLAEAQYYQLTGLVASLTSSESHGTPLRQISPEIFYTAYQSSLINNQPLVFSYVDLRAVPSMAGLYLYKADFRGSNLSGLCLRNVNLEEARLSSALFHKSDLSHATLRSATLLDAELDGADLRSTLLDRCRLAGASLVNVDLRQAYMRSARLSSKTNLKGAMTDGARGLETESLVGHGSADTSSHSASTAGLVNGLYE